MNTHQKLISIALPLLSEIPLKQRVDLLEEAAKHLPVDMARVCLAQAICLRQADRYQLKLTAVLESVK